MVKPLKDFKPHWPRDERFDNLRVELQQFTALQTQFGLGAAEIETIYKSPRKRGQKLDKLLMLLSSRCDKVKYEIEECLEQVANDQV